MRCRTGFIKHVHSNSENYSCQQYLVVPCATLPYAWKQVNVSICNTIPEMSPAANLQTFRFQTYLCPIAVLEDFHTKINLGPNSKTSHMFSTRRNSPISMPISQPDQLLAPSLTSPIGLICYSKQIASFAAFSWTAQQYSIRSITKY